MQLLTVINFCSHKYTQRQYPVLINHKLTQGPKWGQCSTSSQKKEKEKKNLCEWSPSDYEALSQHCVSLWTLILAQNLRLQDVVGLKSLLGPARKRTWSAPKQRLQFDTKRREGKKAENSGHLHLSLCSLHSLRQTAACFTGGDARGLFQSPCWWRSSMGASLRRLMITSSALAWGGSRLNTFMTLRQPATFVIGRNNWAEMTDMPNLDFTTACEESFGKVTRREKWP